MYLSQAIFAYEGLPTAVFESILSQVVSSCTQGNYAYHNVDLILWIYEREKWREELPRDWIMERLIAAEERGEKETRDTCEAALEGVNKRDDKCPIVLEKMTFNFFSHYMSTKKSKKSGGYLSTASYCGVRSSLTHLYPMSGKTMDGELKKELYQFMSGIKRVVASNKRESGASLDEWKKAMSLEACKRLCEELYNGKGDDHLFAHAFLTTEWNLMARSDNCINMHVQHIQWR